jgi:hypothetical protein
VDLVEVAGQLAGRELAELEGVELDAAAAAAHAALAHVTLAEAVIPGVAAGRGCHGHQGHRKEIVGVEIGLHGCLRSHRTALRETSDARRPNNCLQAPEFSMAAHGSNRGPHRRWRSRREFG